MAMPCTTSNVVQQNSDKYLMFLPWERFCNWVRNIQLRINVQSLPLVRRSDLTDEVEWYALTFILQCRFRSQRFYKDWMIVTVDESRPIYRNSKHAELVSKALQVFYWLIHCHKLTPKRASLHCRLLLGIPVDRSIVQHGNEDIPWPPRQRLSCMFSFHKETNCEAISKCMRHVGWKSLPNFFTRRGIDRVAPILAMKGIHVNVWFTRT